MTPKDALIEKMMRNGNDFPEMQRVIEETQRQIRACFSGRKFRGARAAYEAEHEETKG